MNFFAVPATQRTVKIPESFMLPKASDLITAFQGSALNITFVFAILLALIIYFIIYKTRFGYNLRAVGFNEIASADDPASAAYSLSPSKFIISTLPPPAKSEVSDIDISPAKGLG